MYTKMLVPLDGSKLAEEVFPYARELAGRLGLDLAFLNVCSPHETELLPMRQAYMAHMAETLCSQSCAVQEQTSGIRSTRKIKAVGQVVVGHPAEEILKYAEDNNIDLILMSTHGYSGVKRWALGSTTYKVLHASKVPVWLVRAGLPEETVYDKWPQRTILVPLDGSLLAEEAVPHAETLVRQSGYKSVELLFLTVCEPDLIPEVSYYAMQNSYPAAEPLKYSDYMKKETARATEASRQYLNSVAARLQPQGYLIRTEVLAGNASEEIIKYANKNPFQLIVMTSHGRSGFNRLAFGSVTEKILLQTNTPILITMPQS
jgi:nucleotide-binding universal stress UspA family protein